MTTVAAVTLALRLTAGMAWCGVMAAAVFAAGARRHRLGGEIGSALYVPPRMRPVAVGA